MMATRWHLITSKAHKESYAEEQLNNQGFTTYLPVVSRKKKVRGKMADVVEPLFPRYIFIMLEEGVDNWSAVRSTRGVVNFVRFGIEPAVVHDNLIESLKNSEEKFQRTSKELDGFKLNEKVLISTGVFSGLEASFNMYSGDERVIVLLNVMQQATKLSIPAQDIKKIA